MRRKMTLVLPFPGYNSSDQLQTNFHNDRWLLYVRSFEDQSQYFGDIAKKKKKQSGFRTCKETRNDTFFDSKLLSKRDYLSLWKAYIVRKKEKIYIYIYLVWLVTEGTVEE